MITITITERNSVTSNLNHDFKSTDKCSQKVRICLMNKRFCFNVMSMKITVNSHVQRIFSFFLPLVFCFFTVKNVISVGRRK